MRQPHELMADDYCGPSKVINLGQIQNRDGFRFIGIDKHGKEHFCIVRKGDGGSFYMNSNTALFEDLCGWLPDPDAPPNRDRKKPRGPYPRVRVECGVRPRQLTESKT